MDFFHSFGFQVSVSGYFKGFQQESVRAYIGFRVYRGSELLGV